MKLKYKFLIFFASVFTVSLLVLSLINIDFFKKDKLAYVFASMIDSSQTSSMLLTAEISALDPLFEILVANFDFNTLTFPANRKRSLQITNTVQFIEVHEIKGTEKRILDSIGDISAQDREWLLKGKQTELTTITFFPGRKDLYAVTKLVAMKGYGSEKFLFNLVLKRNPFFEIINKPRFFDLFLVSEKGYIEQKPQRISEPTYLEILNNFFKNNKTKFATPLTTELKVGDQQYLATWSPLGYGNLGFVSILKSEKALQTIAKATQTSLAVFLLLLGGGLTIVMLLIGNLTKSLEMLSSMMNRFSQGELEVRAEIKTSDEVGVLAKVFNQMTLKIKELIEETKHKARMESELETARTVQQRLIPQKADFETNEGIIFGHYEPASECGGDWWFYFNENNIFYFIIADVTGHGVPSALITSALRAAVSAQAGIDKTDLTSYVSVINKVIADSASGAINSTSFLGRYMKDSETIEYVNVSHCAPVLVRSQSGKQEYLDEICGPRLGEQHESTYRSVKVKVAPGDFIFVYTDGLSEFKNAEGKMFGDLRISKSLSKYYKEKTKISQYRSKLLNDFKAYRKQLPLDDDLTFFFFQAK